MKSIAIKWWSCVISQLLLLLLVVMPTQIVHANNLFNNEVAKDTRIIGGERVSFEIEHMMCITCCVSVVISLCMGASKSMRSLHVFVFLYAY